MGLLGKLDGHTLLLLTSEESIDLRTMLSVLGAVRAQAIIDSGIARGTAKLSEEFKAEQARKKAAKK